MLSRPEHLPLFPTLTSIRPPRAAIALGWMIGIGTILTVLMLLYVPWVQTSAGTGRVIAPNPADRVQTITALVQGRVEHWYVEDGQQVRTGDPIARLVDNDPFLLQRLAAEREQIEAEIEAADQAVKVAESQVNQTREAAEKGFVTRRNFEAAQIRVAERRARLAEVRAKLSRLEVTVNRQSAQLVRAPRDGRILHINAAAAGALVSPGDTLATLAPHAPFRVVELMIDGRDVALVRPGQTVRLEFEGWPAIQFSGWPSVAHGMFDGRVRAVDPSAQPSGLFRVLVEQDRAKLAWPDVDFIPLGAKVRGWIRMDSVALGYELWRVLNNFPLEFPKARLDPI
ncbi:efflux RND transporter periplasmic adaptor subunit [Methylobacterium sp. NEAU K]|uniref:efflux RND transporter periplasmic adaptor subunit n=1 Tax=Methylobacterium sp. NEAU K TaxID=3064946 RepID=UPI002733B52F|nr:HlyD family efflux transporter periplasmic adaptor subunit [Methylobacterium sp. NEAU K]MDP4006547.1 HlyD family efflux transporter periplasmic adaptor subunit [Methylobacterium sp. NEAU K]